MVSFSPHRRWLWIISPTPASGAHIPSIFKKERNRPKGSTFSASATVFAVVSKQHRYFAPASNLMSPGYSLRDHIVHRRIIYQSNAIIWSSFCLALLREISISQTEVLSMLLSDSISSFRANFYLVAVCFTLPSRSSIYGEHIQFLKHIYSCVGLFNSCDASSSSRYYVLIISV